MEGPCEGKGGHTVTPHTPLGQHWSEDGVLWCPSGLLRLSLTPVTFPLEQAGAFSSGARTANVLGLQEIRHPSCVIISVAASSWSGRLSSRLCLPNAGTAPNVPWFL